MAAPQPQSEPAWNALLGLVVIGLIAWGLWWFCRPQLLEILRYLRLAELWFVGLFVGHPADCFNWLRWAPVADTVPPPQIIKWADGCFGSGFMIGLPAGESVDYLNLSGISAGAIERKLTPFFRWPLAALFVGLAVYAIFFSPRNKFRTQHTLESFIKVQAKMWPVIAPIVNFKPSDYSARTPGQQVPDKLPPFAEALSPEEWVAWHRIPVTNGIPDREAARRAFLLQIGPRWQGIEGQPPHIQALFAAFALKGVQKREESDEFLGQLSLCWSLKGGFNMDSKTAAEVRRIVRDPAIGGQALEISKQHAYRTTALLGVLKWARWMGGVLAPAQFLWLRATDRGLWYPLNNLGRRSFHTEGAGAMAHYMAELNAKKPLPIPRIDTAIVTLNQYLASTGQQIPPREEPAGSRSS